MTYQGQGVIHRTASDEYHYAVIAGNIINDGDTADLLTFENGDTWYTTNDINTIGIPHAAVDRGTGVGEWQAIEDGVWPPSLTLSTPTRVIGTPFQLSTTRPALVSYSARVSSTLTVTGGAAGRIELRCDASNPPTTVRKRVAGGLTGSVVIGVAVTDIAEGDMSILVPPGAYVLLQSVSEVGTPTFSLTGQLELLL